jgi:hypothetical protein
LGAEAWEDGNLRTRDLMRSGFVASTCHQLLDKDELSLGPGDNTQILEYSEAILVGPVVKHLADKEDRDVFLLRGLRVKETLALGTRSQGEFWGE